MLDRQSGEMGVGDEIAAYTGQRHEISQDFRMAFCGQGRPRGFTIKPCKHLTPRISGRLCMSENSRIRHDSQERECAGPRQSDGRGAIQLIVEPAPGCVMLRQRADVCVNEDVGIDQYHLKPSPSVIASTSAILSMPAIWSGPRSTDRVRTRRRRFVCALISFMPRRRASLTSSFKLASRLRRRRSSAMATSSSMVRVVLMHQSIHVMMP